VENREKLRLVLRKQGTTLTKLLIAIANEQELKLKPLEEARVTGYQEAKRLYMVYFHCDVCGKPILINNPKIKEAVRQYLSDAGFGHSECHNKPLQS
jgi:hypothetical protein